MSDSRTARQSVRRLAVGGGILLLIEAVALVLVVLARPAVLLPVTASLSGERQLIAEVHLGAAAVVLLVVGSVSLLTLHPTGGRARSLRWAAFSVTSSVTVFLIAQLNGVTELTTLVALYAMTSAMTLFVILQDRADVRAGHPMLALCFGAAVGIVPWGLIAFAQIGAGLVGDAASVVVRVITLVMLGFAAAFFLTQWREQRRLGAGGDALPSERAHIVLGIVAPSVFAWVVALGVAPGG